MKRKAKRQRIVRASGEEIARRLARGEDRTDWKRANPKPKQSTIKTDDSGDKTEKDEGAKSPPPQEDIQLADIHVKTRKFLEKYQLSADELNEIFFKEGTEFRPLFDDLKTTKMGESQIRVALLQALRNSLNTGEFQFNGEEVRAECQMRKCYDISNFSAIFKTHGGLFDGFESYMVARYEAQLDNAFKRNMLLLERSQEGRRRLRKDASAPKTRTESGERTNKIWNFRNEPNSPLAAGEAAPSSAPPARAAS